MLKNVKKSIHALAFGSTMVATKAFAQSQTDTLEKSVNAVTPSGTSTTTLPEYIQIIINVLIGLIGVIAVIMLIYGGFTFVLSGGDEKATKRARETILFAVVGIVIAILAFAIVNFVIGSFS